MKALVIFSLTAVAGVVIVSLPIIFAERAKKQTKLRENRIFMDGARAAGAWLATSPQPPYPVTEVEWLNALAPFRSSTNFSSGK